MQIPKFDFDKDTSDLCKRIEELLTAAETFNSRKVITHLRKTSHVKSIRSSLAIEGNDLSEVQIRDTIRGRTVEGPFDEVVEAKNAVKAYDLIPEIDVFSIDCFLKVESVMMWGLTEYEGFRTGQVVITDGDSVFYKPPAANEVPAMVDELFAWCSKSGHPAYVVAAVMHYYIESIHPFPDGNGRMGRLWHNAMLVKGSKVFRMVSIENVIRDRQQDYYDVLERCQNAGDCTEFLKFMLGLTVVVLENLKQLQNPYIFSLLSAMGDNPMTASEILRKMKMSDRGNLQKRYLKPAIDCGFVAMTDPDHPHSPVQMYVRLIH